MSDAYEAKYQEMQKYVPFIQRVIEKLKVNNDQPAENPRKTQLQKMEMLHELLTNKNKKIKIETLIKCEGVVKKLQAKIEKQTSFLQNEDVILNDVKLKQQTSCKPITSTSHNSKVHEVDDLLGPASPPPEVIVDDIDQPVVIPTERRCSPILVKETTKIYIDKSDQHGKERSDQHRLQDTQHSTSSDYQNLNKKSFHLDSRSGSFTGKQNKKNIFQERTHYDSYTSSPKHQNAKEIQHSKHVNPARESSHVIKKNVEQHKGSSSEQKLQKVKVVITEPLPAHIQKQHFPSFSKYMPRSSVCHNNLKALPQATQTKDDYSEPYIPEEFWEKCNSSHKGPIERTPSTAPVFSRLGAKVPENSTASSSTSNASGRYTPIPDVLKSPPLSVSDIKNLLLESGADKMMNDISEIGSRRPTKNEDNQKALPKNSFEFVRQKLAQTARMQSAQHSEITNLQTDKYARNISPPAHERIALKYNPHPRQERLQSISSTDDSECGTAPKTNDTRAKLNLQTGSFMHSPKQVATSNVNVLPAINLSDPRLKKQNIMPMSTERKSLPSSAPIFTSTLNKGFQNKNPVSYDDRKDPRISRIPSSTLSANRTPPTRKVSTNKPQYSSEENWDSDEEEKTRTPIKTDPREAKKDAHKVESSVKAREDVHFERNYTDTRNGTLNESNILNHLRYQSLSGVKKLSSIGSESEESVSKLCSRTNVDAKGNQNKVENFTKQNIQNDTALVSKMSKNILKPSTTYVPNPPTSDTEDWDSDGVIKIVEAKARTSDGPQLPINKSPLVSVSASYPIQISPKPFVNPIHISPAAVPPVHITQSQYSLIGSTHHRHSHLMQNSAANNRFNSVLNDKSERSKYFEAKKQKTIEPRTYKEFREAKERAQAQEAAIKRAADEAESKKIANELNDIQKNKIKENTGDRKEQQMDTSKKAEQDKKEKKLTHKNIKTPLAGESTLDKMYRTQNFSSKFPKANTSFKIPKKKTEEITKEEATKAVATAAEHSGTMSNAKLDHELKPNQAKPITDIKAPVDQELNNKCSQSSVKANETDSFNSTQIKTVITSDKSEVKLEQPQCSNDNLTQKQKPVNGNTTNKFDNHKITSDTLSNTSLNKQLEKKKINENIGETDERSEEQHLSENYSSKSVAVDNKIIVRDPRCKPKPTLIATEELKKKELPKEHFEMFENIVITSSENQVILKPQQNLDKFNQLTQELTPKPQRVLRRRNTMVVFDSAPLVDKEKLRKANALLFEDVQEEEKRKRKQAEEDRLIARRNKNLEEMFKKTDDNCTVSTQNIITGKRRTRATINFNETVNAINVFKHTTMKDSSSGNLLAPSPGSEANKITRSKFKNLEVSETKDDESDDDENLESLARKGAKTTTKSNRTKSSTDINLKDENKTEEPDIKTNTNVKKRASVNKRSSTNNAVEVARNSKVNNAVKFKPQQNDEHQNCAVSSTSTDICAMEETTCSSTSTNISLKKESDDNEPTSTASKSDNPTPSVPEPNLNVLYEIVDQLLKSNDGREHILGELGQIIGEERLVLIKSLIKRSNRHNEDHQIKSEDIDKQIAVHENHEVTNVSDAKESIKNKVCGNQEDEYNEGEKKEENQPKPTKASGGKKKRSELDRLNEDIRDMFICEGVLTATGRRMCTIMGKDVDLDESKKSTAIIISEQENTYKRKEEMLKPPVTTRTLRRSLRCCKTTEDNEDNESHSNHSRTTEESLDDFNTSNENCRAADTTPQRKMPVLKPHTPIKIPDDVATTKESAVKRKSDNKFVPKAKKSKTSKDESKEDSEAEENESRNEAVEVEKDAEKRVIKNDNVHWHNQSKYATWCMICEKRIPANASSLHYKTHHRENYISRMAPVLLQQFKQGKLNQPLFGVKKAQKQPSWFYRCPFCLKYFNTSIPLWLEHFQNHTVEFRYECSECHRCSNRKIVVSRHIKNCEGATVITSAMKLNVPTVINAHVCHLCNFIQLKRVNLERHYIEQHKLEEKTVDLLGYTIKLFDVEKVECVTEENAVKREKEAWKSIEKNEQVIDIDDDEESSTPTDNFTICGEDAAGCEEEKGNESVAVNTISKEKTTSNHNDSKNNQKDINVQLQQTKETADKKNKSEFKVNELQAKNFDKISNLPNQQSPKKSKQEENASNVGAIRKEKLKPETSIMQTDKEGQAKKIQICLKKSTKLLNAKESGQKEEEETAIPEQEEIMKNQNATDAKNKNDKTVLRLDITESQSNDFELIYGRKTVQDIQDELLTLAAEAAEKEDENQKSENVANNDIELQTSSSNQGVVSETLKTTADNIPLCEPQTSMSDIISSSIDMIYNRACDSTDKRMSISVEPSEANKVCVTASNVFMPTRDENNYSPTIQILAQSIINIEEGANDSFRNKPITMAERLSQRFKSLQNETTIGDNSNICSTRTSTYTNSNDNVLEKLVNDTLMELTKVKDNGTVRTSTQTSPDTSVTQQSKGNVFDKLFSDTALEIEKDKENESFCGIMQQKEIANIPKDVLNADVITVISDDEDWEDIEITETAPTTSATSAANIQKSKNKFQKFGIFKGNNTKSKKHLSPMAYLPKKKAKEKTLQAATALSPLPITTTTTTPTVATTKINEITTPNSFNNTNAHLGFKPVINIMDGLFPDSPCNDPIDLVPELAPLEPLQDLNDISSILDSNLSAVNINAADNHTSIEDALDFISEQQANDMQKSNSLALPTMPIQSKTIINNISHVGFSMQTSEENTFKFYCLLQNCSFLYSSDSIGLETHFMCEHSQIKWNGYCLMCQSQCFTNADAGEEHSISKEIRHMMEKHANKPILDLNTDSTQNSTTSSQDSEERPKIKLRRLTGDCLSRATQLNVASSNEVVPCDTTTNVPQQPMSMLGALLVAEPKPPTKEIPPQPQMPFTEPLLLDNNTEVSSQLPFKNVTKDLLITSVTSAAPKPNETPLQISSVISLNKAIPSATESEQVLKISNVRTLAPKVGSLWSQQIEKDRMDMVEAAEASLEVSRILENARTPSTNREATRSANDSPVLVAETVPLAQSKTGDFVITQTVSAQYNEFSSTALGFNISIAASTTGDKTNTESIPISSTSMASRQYKCMGNGCKFVNRVPVAMSDHLRFHERRNLSNIRDYLSCGFCFYSASDVEDYMKHANQFHIINKGGTAPLTTTTSTETDTATSLTAKKQNILNLSNSSSRPSKSSVQNLQQNQTTQLQDTQEVYAKKLRETIDEIVGPTGLADDKLYRCVVKNCHSQLTESTFLSHIMFHITTTGGNPNNYVFKCPHCTAQYHRPAGIKAHIKNHARNRYFCYLCDETSTNPGQLLKHFSEKHWHTLNMYTKELLKPKTSTDGSDSVLDSSYYVAYTQDLSAEEVRKFGEKLILEWQRKKSGSKTHFKSTEIDLLPLSAIFQRQVNCGECEYKTKVRTNMYRHLLMHKQDPGLASKSGVSKVCSVDPVNPVPCLNSSERFFDKMTNLASSSLIPSSSVSSSTTKHTFKIPHAYVEEAKRFTCGCPGCNYHTISEDLFRTHLSTLHSTAMTYCCTFCHEDICKRGITIDRIMNHTRFHGATIYRCEECNYVHHLRYVVERHINERHSTMKVNIVTHNRSSEDREEGTTTSMLYTGKKYKETVDINQTAQTSNPSTRSTNIESSGPKPLATYVNSTKSKGKWMCDMCGQRASTVSQIQTHCQQQHGVKNQYKCAHCNFGSQQLSQILFHIDEKHSGKTREANYMYHKIVNSGEDVADTRPLWQRNDPTRIRHIRGILMEDEEESEEYRKQLALIEDVDDDSIDQNINVEENEEDLTAESYVSGYEFGCYHCAFKTQTFEDLKNQHYAQTHNSPLETAKPFWYRLHRRLCCPDCRSFLGNYSEMQQHLQNEHKKSRFYAADIRMAEYDDTSHRLLCAYCTFHCANADHLYKHHLRAQHWPQDVRIDNDQQIVDILALGKAETSYQCTLCADIFPNRVAIVQHACNTHAGEDSFSFRELTNSLIYRCNSCCFTSTMEIELMRHTIDHYSRFRVCNFCNEPQTSFNGYMQHCYAEHKNHIQKFKTIYPLIEIRKFLLQTLIVFPNGLVLNKRNLLNTKYGKTEVIDEVYEDIYKISQQPPIPRLSIARLVARKSIEAQQKHVDYSSSPLQNEILEPHPKIISKRRRTVAFSLEDHNTNDISLLKPKLNIVEAKKPATIAKRRTTVDHDQQQQQKHKEFNVPVQYNKISKRRRTVAVDRETLFSSNLISTTNSSLTVHDASTKKRKSSFSYPHTLSPKHAKETYPLNLDIDPFSFYGQTPEAVDLSKIYTKVAIGGIKTPLTIDKFKLLFNIECQLKLTKCDNDTQLSHDYSHINKACPASQKLKYNLINKKE